MTLVVDMKQKPKRDPYIRVIHEEVASHVVTAEQKNKKWTATATEQRQQQPKNKMISFTTCVKRILNEMKTDNNADILLTCPLFG